MCDLSQQAAVGRDRDMGSSVGFCWEVRPLPLLPGLMRRTRSACQLDGTLVKYLHCCSNEFPLLYPLVFPWYETSSIAIDLSESNTSRTVHRPSSSSSSQTSTFVMHLPSSCNVMYTADAHSQPQHLSCAAKSRLRARYASPKASNTDQRIRNQGGFHGSCRGQVAG